MMVLSEEVVDVVSVEVKEAVDNVDSVEVGAVTVETAEEVVEAPTDHRMAVLLETRTIEAEKQQFRFK